MLYRIFTENKNQNQIEQIINKYFEGFTIVKGDGFWRAQKENSLIIEIVTEEPKDKINSIAKEIKVVNGQDAVLVQRIKNNQWYV